jgi:hypothetical protein
MNGRSNVQQRCLAATQHSMSAAWFIPGESAFFFAKTAAVSSASIHTRGRLLGSGRCDLS